MQLEYDQGEANSRPGCQRGYKGIKPCLISVAIGGLWLLLSFPHVIWWCGRRARASKVIGQGKSGRYVLVLVQDPKKMEQQRPAKDE